ncbi:MAG: choice-of-anchor D domain-containing protein [Terracidiphilus sp.]|jgi:DNA-binding beta-propeller fold protein YncE
MKASRSARFALFLVVACVCQALIVSPVAHSQVAPPEVDFGAANIGIASSVIGVPLTFKSAAALGGVSVLTEGATGLDFAKAAAGTCTVGASYNAGDSCTVNVTFTPVLAGSRYGAVALVDSSYKVIATSYLHGTGVGPHLNSLPDTGKIMATSAMASLSGGAVKASGDVSVTATTPTTCTLSGSITSPFATEICPIQSLTTNLATQTITFGAIPTQAVNTSVGVALTATASSGLPVSFTSTTPAACTVSASTATLLAAGTCTIQANQAGNSAYAAAPAVTQSFTVESANPLTGTSFGSMNIGSVGSPTPVTITFPTAATLGSVSVLTQGATGLDFNNAGAGTCTAGTSYNEGGSCTVNVTFTPTFAGSRYGAIVLEDRSGKVIATSYLQGTGVGPQVNFLPGAESTVLTSDLSYPSGVAVDGSGNVYIVDSGNSRILKETLSAGSYTESTVPTSALNWPSGVAVDGSGNLYIADSGNNRVLKETLTGSSYTESTVPTSALNWPSGVAVDGSGNIYIADSGNNRILVEILTAGSYTESSVPTSALSYPSGVVVDGSGNIYISDSGNNRILMEALTAGSYAESTVPTSALSYPSDVAVDGGDNVYIVDTGNNRVLKETLSSGSYTESTVPTSSLAYPSGIVVGGNGNVYIADSGNNRALKEDFSDPSSLSFAATAPGSTSSDSPQTITLENVGNAVLNFPVLSSGSNPSISANFMLNASRASSCPLVSAGSSAAGTLAAGQSCLLFVSFTPPAAGTFSGTLVLTDNALNAAAPGSTVQQSLVLSGIGTGNTQQSITFGLIPAQATNSILGLTATASSGLPVSFTSTTPAICTVTGSTASLLVAGTCTIQANQAGNPVYAAAAMVTQSFAVNLTAQTITFVTIPAQALNTSVPVPLTATASSGLPVSFNSTTPAICTVSATASTVAFLADGTCTIQASQPGDGVVYAAAPTVTQSFTVQSANPLTGTSFGVVSIGSTSSAITVSLTFNTVATLGSVSVLTQGATGLDFANAGAGSCTTGTSYNVSSSCTVNVTFTPTFAGGRYGAVVLEDGSGNVIATSYLQGTGVGPQVNFLPGTESTVATSALSYPSGVVVDGSGNVYIADAGNNRLLKETLSAGSYTESTVPTSALAYPSGVVVDGSGNVYIADTGNNRVLKETLSAGNYTESTVPTSALAYPSGVAVDGSGNVYIADTGNSRVLMETPSSTDYTESAVPTSAANLQGISVDGSGNVYIVDSGNNRVLIETLSSGSYTESTLPTSALAYPSGVFVAVSGNVYIADTGNNRVLVETLSAGSYTESTVPTSALSYPSGVAVAGSGNVYIVDTGNNRVLKEDVSDPPSLSFAATALGSTSSDSPQVVTLVNAGNAVLNFPIPSSGNNPSIATNFTLGNGGASACPQVSAGSSTAGMLGAGQSCLLLISFMPAATGNISGTLVLTDSALNATAPGYATQSILLSGTGTGSTPQSITFGSIPAQSVNSILSLTATASSGLSISFMSTTPAICTVTGSTASLLATGTCTIQASQGGSSVYAAAPAVTQSFTVNPLAQTITFGTIPAQTANTSVGIALTATASSGLPVSFTSTTPAICTVSASTATLLAPGTCTIQANQAGNVLYAAAPMVTQSFTVESVNPLTGTNLGTVNIGSANSAIAVPITFNTAATLGSVSVLTQGATGLDFVNAGTGSCTAGTSYIAAGSCTVNVTFKPVLTGTRYGAVVLLDGSGNVIGTSYLQGTGVGPQVNFLPGAESAVSTSGTASPSGIAVDASGSIYIADSGNDRVLKETLTAGSYTESTVPTSALAYPYGIAVDGSGSVYIADYGNNRVLKETLSAGSYTESTVPTSNLSYPSGVAVDGSGNVYIADTYNNRVLMETLSSGSYTESTVPTSGLNGPSGVVVDGSGNLYIADSGNNRVLKETLSAGSYTESIVPTSALSFPAELTVDGSGNIFIADSGNSRVLKETLSAGSYTESMVPTSSLNWPSGVAVDGSGNVYIADSGNNRVLNEDFADPPSLSFAITAPGSTSSDSPQIVTLENAGNAVLNVPLPSSGNNPSILGNFTLNGSVTSACPLVSAGSSTAGTLAAGQSCLLSISFTPPAAGTFSGTLVLTDNTLNATAPGFATQSILLSGIGAGSTQQTITFWAIPAQSVESTIVLAASASSGLPVSLTSTTPSVCTVSASFASLLAAGTCTIQANQAGSPVYAAAPTVTQSFTVNLLAQTIIFSAIPAQMINTSVSITLNAWADSGLPVSFTSTTPTICTASSAASTATLLAAGTCTIQASQPGDGVMYAAAPAVTQSFTVQSANPLTATSFGAANIGSVSSAISVPLTFTTSATLSSVSVMTEGATGLDFANANGGTCTVGTTYNAGGSCTVTVTFAPTLAGTRFGAAVLNDTNGNVVATGYLQGLGVGPQVNFLPGTGSRVLTSSLFAPYGVAVDGSGNVYIADTWNSRVLKETLSVGSYTESTISTSALNHPYGVAVDGSGNVYIADSYNNRVLKETLSSGSYTESTVPTSALYWPYGVAVDGSGNVYVADTSNNRVLMETLSAGSYTESTLPTSAAYPSGVAVDGNGNVYIADTSNNRVLMETFSAGGYTESTLSTSALNPSEITVDGRGIVYIVDSGTNTVLKEIPSAGSYTESTAPIMNPIGYPPDPYGIAVDGSGNIYIVEGDGLVLKEDFADPPSLSFALTAPGLTSSDSPQTVTVQNIGNAPLSIPIPGSGDNPNIPANFTLNSGGTSSCPLVSAGSSSAGMLAAGASCLLPISFTPAAAGNFSATLALTDNALNTAAPGYMTQSILLSGTGRGSTQQSITFGPIPAQTLYFPSFELEATANSGLTVSFTSTTPAICTVAGSYATLLAAGICTIQANQAGNSVYAPAPAVTQSLTINLLAQTITFGAIPTQVFNTSVTVTLTLGATASSGLPVIYTSTTPTICTVTNSTPFSNATVALLALGTCTIQANQAGDGLTYAAAPMVTLSFTVGPASPLTGTNFGTVNIGNANSAVAVPITFGTAATLGSISVLTQGATGLDFANAGGGTCAVGTSYNVGDSCAVIVMFAPTLAGTRYGAVVLDDGSGNVIATGYLQGTGVGPQVNFLPNTESTVPSSALSSPSGVAVDASGNIYIADTYNQRVLKESLSEGSYTESTVPTSALIYPYGIAVDGGGNLYIADTGNNWVLKETLSEGSYTESIVPTSNLNYPFGVAVDGSGNVYIADSENYRVLVEILSAGGYTESTLPTSAVYPVGVAVDGQGDVYIADASNQRVLKETLSAGSYAESTLPTSALGSPDGVAVDGNGNVYITNYYGYGLGNSNVLKETLSGGSYTESTVQTSPLNGPFEIAVDGGGNVYIADTLNSRVLEEDFADPPSLSFATTVVGSTSSDSPQTVTLENIGNGTLNFPIPSSGNNPSISANFTLNASGASACPLVGASASTAGTLAAGQSCLLPISFAPTAAGALSGSLTLTDNALNAVAPGFVMQSIQLSGTGTQASQTSNLTALASQATAIATTARLAFGGVNPILTETVAGFVNGDTAVTRAIGASNLTTTALASSPASGFTANAVADTLPPATDSSTSASGTLTVMPLDTAATPMFTPAAGTYSPTQTVTISDTASGSTIYYTTNGTTPTASSTMYTGAITVSASETIKAIAVATGYTNSAVASAAYTIK